MSNSPSIVTVHRTGAITCEGPEAVECFRIATMISGLKFEIRCPGVKLTRGPSCYTLAKREFQFRGNRQSVLEQLEAKYAEMRAEVPTVVEAANEEPSQ